MARFSITSLGCKVNQYDAACITTALEGLGLEHAEGDGPDADLVVISTCCVTATAMRKSRQAIRRAVRGAPAAAVLVAGCYCDYDARRLADLLDSLGVPSDRIVLAGNHDDLGKRVKQAWTTLAAQRPDAEQTTLHTREADAGLVARADCDAEARLCRNDQCMNAGTRADQTSLPNPTSIKARRNAAVNKNFPPAGTLGPIEHFPGHQRAFVKVQDGCDAFCSYCIVPYTRPRVASRTIEQIADECETLVAAGHREIVLCGVFLGAFGRDTAVRKRWPDSPSKLPDLLRRIAAIDGLWRVRLSSIEPGDLTDDLLGAMRDTPAVAPHLHLPLQSGSEKICRRMGRQYTPDQFRRTVGRLRDALDRPAITTDIIVAFPGETDADFADTLELARCAAFAKIHAFPFSPIEPTAAWAWRDQAPPPAVAKARMAALAELERTLAESYRRQFVGETVEGLVEGDRGGRTAQRRAMTDRYQTVFFDDDFDDDRSPGGENLTGKIVNLRIQSVRDDGLDGELLSLA